MIIEYFRGNLRTTGMFGRQINSLELQAAFEAASKLVAFKCDSLACDIHENCSGSCTDASREAPTLDSPSVNLSKTFPALSYSGPSRTTPYDKPHDLDWVEQQQFQTYKYAAIDSLAGEVRLLRIRKAAFRSDVVDCEIVTVFLGHGTTFDALSYCCGSADVTDVMLCDGKLHLIRPSLNAALKAFRESMSQATLLWTDAVSINQEDQVELSEQIPLMRRIYKEAASVSVYLGPATPEFSQALSLMYKLYIVQMHQLYPSEFGSISAKDVNLPPRNDILWITYLAMFSSPWFNRTWIIQEIILTNRATVNIGRYSFDWQILEYPFDFFIHNRLEDIVSMDNINAIASMNPLEYLKGIYSLVSIQHTRLFAESSDAKSVVGILKVTRPFEVSKPSDKVVGVLGLFGHLDAELRSLSDPNLTTAQVFHKIAVYLISDGFAADILEQADMTGSIKSLETPSWVPDWTVDPKMKQTPLTSYRSTRLAAGGPDDLLMCIVEKSDYPSELRLLGHCKSTIVRLSDRPQVDVLDDIQRIFNIPSNPSPPLSALFTWHESARACLDDTCELPIKDIEETFIRTLLVDDLRGPGAMLQGMTALNDLVPTYREAVARLDTAKSSENPNQAYNDLIEAGDVKDAVQSLILQMIGAMRSRRFAITDDGYMCLVPSRAQLGDAVGIILGCRTPFTIRPHPGQCIHDEEAIRAKLIGPTYMHGAMAGELLPEWPPDVIVLT